MNIETYRILLACLAGFCATLNMFVAFQWTRAWVQAADKELRHTLRGPSVYPIIAMLVGLNSLYFRLNKDAFHAPANLGDFLALIPAVGFTIAAWVSLGNYARVEALMQRLRFLESKEGVEESIDTAARVAVSVADAVAKDARNQLHRGGK